MKKISLIFTLFLTAATPAFSLTIDEAVVIALERNNRIKQFGFLAGSQGDKVKSQKSEFYPAVDLGYTYSRQEEDVFFGTKNTSIFTAEASYNLFKGFIDRNDLEKEEHRYDADRFQERAVVSDVVFAVKSAFIEVLKTASNLEVAKEAVELLERQKKDSELRFREGLIAKNDLLSVEVDLASARFAQFQVESNLKTARETLERIMGRSLEPGGTLDKPSDPGELKLSREELRKEMYGGRSELKYLESLILADRSELAAISGEYWPAVDFFLTYRRLGDSLVPDGRAGMFITDTELSGSVVATWNLFNGYRTTHDRAAKLKEVKAREEELKDLERELDLQLERALENYRISKGQLGVTEDSIKQAEENLRITNNRYNEAIVTITDLLDARVKLTRAHFEFNTAFYNIMLSLAEIERVVETHPASKPGRENR